MHLLSTNQISPHRPIPLHDKHLRHYTPEAGTSPPSDAILHPESACVTL